VQRKESHSLSSRHVIYLFSNHREKREIAAGAGNMEGKRGDQRKFLSSYAPRVGEPKDNPLRRRQPPVVVIKKKRERETKERVRENNGYMCTHKGPTLLIARLL